MKRSFRPLAATAAIFLIAYAASVLSMTAGLGAGIAVMLVPLADLAPWAWRIIYVVPLLFLPLFVNVGRRLPESRRFVRPHGRATMAGHRRRLLLLATVAFLGLMFWAPNTQFHNDFLRNAASYLVGGPMLWITALVGSIVAAVTVPALAVYGPELFPTALRAKANGIIAVAGVAGSAVGLVAGGRMHDHFGRYGPGIAVLAVGPFLVAALVLALYPETAHLELEELNPEDAIGASLPVL